MPDISVSLCYVGGERVEYKFISLAPIHMAGCLQSFGIKCELVEITPENYNQIETIEPLLGKTIVGFSCNSFTYPFLIAVLRKLKQISPETITVMGGIHMLRNYKEVLLEEPVDYIIRGEADFSLGQLVNALLKKESIERIPGLAFMQNHRSMINHSLDNPVFDKSIPLPAYNLIKKQSYILTFETSRGCPFGCFFCSLDQKSKWHGFETALVLERFERAMELINNIDSIHHILFCDDNFATSQSRAVDILKLIHQGFPQLSFWFETRVREVVRNPMLIEVCKEENIKINSLLFGIECGYDEGLQKIGKKVTIDEVRRCAKLLGELDMAQDSIYSYIVGFPWETSKERMQTLTFAKEMYEYYGVKGTCFYWFPTPSPLTEMNKIQPDYSIPFWWRSYQKRIHEKAVPREIELMGEINRNGEFPIIF